MQVSRWGNSLAVRLPAALVDELQLKEGDQIEIDVLGQRQFAVKRAMTREEAVAMMRETRRSEVKDYQFRREDAYER